MREKVINLLLSYYIHVRMYKKHKENAIMEGPQKTASIFLKKC